MEAYKFGKHPAKSDYRTLRFKKYLKDVAAPPDSCNVLDRVYANLNISDPTKLFPMDGNDRYGDCTIAALAHAETVFRGLICCEMIMEEKAVEKLYFKLSGGMDTGLYELDVLNYWRSNQDSIDPLMAFAKIDPKNHVNIKQAINLFGGVYLGFQCQENCVDDFVARKPWTPGMLTNDGHAVFAVAYDQDYVTVLTWGNTQKATWEWWDECVDEAYVLLPHEAKDTDYAPGFDFEQLKEDLDAVAS